MLCQVTNDLEEVASNVIDTCLYKGSRDNMSIVLVTFAGAPLKWLILILTETIFKKIFHRFNTFTVRAAKRP